MIIPGQIVFDVSTDGTVLFISGEDTDGIAYVFDPYNENYDITIADTQDLQLIFTPEDKLFVGNYADKNNPISEEFLMGNILEIEDYIRGVDIKVREDALILKI